MYEIIWLVNCGRVKVENLGLNKPHPGLIPFDWVELDESWVEGDRRGGQMRYLPPRLSPYFSSNDVLLT